MPQDRDRSLGRNPMADLIGPFYDSAAVAAVLHCQVEHLPERVRRGDLLGMQTADSIWVFPVFQFTTDHQIRSDLTPILRQLADHDRWSVGVWLRSPMEDLDDATPESWLAAGGDPVLVHRLAGQAGFRWNA